MKKGFISIICVFLAVILVPSGASLIKGQSDFSERENRALSTRPSFSFDDLLDGFFQEDYENYLSDQFILRDKLVTAKTFALRLIGKKDINNIYIGKNGYLMEKYLPTDFNDETVEENIQLLSDFLNDMAGSYETGCVLVPSKVSVLDNRLPDNAKPYSTDYVAAQLSESLDDDVNFLYLKDELSAHKEEYIYYKSDHHWTSLGAFYGYRALQQSFYGRAVDESMFDVTQVADGFLGTDYDKLQLDTSADTVTRYDRKKPQSVLVDYNGEEDNRTSLYYDKGLSEKDKYTYFLGGNYSRIDITTDVDNEKTLLLVKDSFSNSLVPFLAGDYGKIILVDLRYADDSVYTVLEDEDVTDVLVVYNTEKFMSDTNQSFLESEELSPEDIEGLDVPEEE